MREFMKNNTVTYNLMSFSGFKGLLIFSLLLEGPKTYAELQKALEEHPYLHESVSIDTLRIYLNSLKKVGFSIDKITKNHVTKHYISNIPFSLKITDKQVKSMTKLYKSITKSIDLDDFIVLQSFFNKLSKYILNEDLRNSFMYDSPLANIDPELLKNLIKHTNNNDEIEILYNSPNSGKKVITILADKLNISNDKLYLYGFNSEYQNYSSFLVMHILKILSVNLKKRTLDLPVLTVVYELDSDFEDFELLDCEKILSKSKNKYTVEISSKSKFDIVQRILFFANKCKVISPTDFQQEIINYLRRMKEGYLDEREN